MAGDVVENVEVVVVGGGQAGIAMSEHLGRRGIAHVVLERDRIAEAWRTARWDSLVANGPAWHDRFPGRSFGDEHQDEFVGKERVAEYFAEYAAMIGSPVREGVEVTAVVRHDDRRGFRVETNAGPIDADFVVAATGPFQVPAIPPLVPADAPVLQLHSSAYRNPAQLPSGGVLVVGGGASGVQIADELNRAGCRVHMAIGPHTRPPRRYRGRDFVWWLGVLGHWDLQTPPAGAEHVTIAFSGAYGGRTIDYRVLAAEGMRLHGRLDGYADGVVRFAPDLPASIAEGDRFYLELLDQCDAYVARNGLDLPEEREARVLGPLPPDVTELVLELDLAEEGIGTILWATGFRTDFAWLQVDAFDEAGKPAHRRGVSTEPGVYFLGLPWLSRRGSSFIWGVWSDAGFVAEHIDGQRTYLTYRP
ncbi:MAG: flavin-containing monooxygenase [Gaiellales bacterium]